MKKLKESLLAFLTFFKIGLFTFGGGYAMVAMMEREVSEKRKWIKKEEYLDIIAVAESTPGPIAVNSATYIGYKISGFLGALFCTLGVVLPSFIIIFAISFFFDRFLQLQYVGYAFRGVQAAVAFLIIKAGLKFFKSIKKNFLSVLLLSLTVAALITLTFLSVNFSTVFYIIIGGAAGVFVYLLTSAKNRKKPCENAEDCVKEQVEKQEEVIKEDTENPQKDDEKEGDKDL